MSDLNNEVYSREAYDAAEQKIGEAKDRILPDASVEELKSAVGDREQAEGERGHLHDLAWDEALKIHEDYGQILTKEAGVAQEKADFRREKLGITEEKEVEQEKPFAWEVTEIPKLPGKKILLSETMTGGKTKEVLEAELKDACTGGIYDRAQEMTEEILASEEFKKYTERTEKVQFVRARVGDLGFTNNPTTDQLWARIKEIGELCQKTDALDIRIADKDQPLNEWYSVAMEPISDPDGYSDVFALARHVNGFHLGYDWTNPDSKWDLDYSIVFRLRKVSQES